jgi:hypothetical protein
VGARGLENNILHGQAENIILACPGARRKVKVGVRELLHDAGLQFEQCRNIFDTNC